MAQPNAEPEDDYEYVAILHCRRPAKGKRPENRLLGSLTRSSYESLPPNFSLLQNMAAGAFAGIAEHCASKHSFAHTGYLWLSLDQLLTSCSVSDRCDQGERALRPCQTDIHAERTAQLTSSPATHRHECR